jgi:hypothetical protein
LNTKGCLFQSNKENLEIQGCLFQQKNSTFIAIHLNDPEQSLTQVPEEANSLLKKLYSRLCLKHSDPLSCQSFSLPAFFTGHWNTALPFIKSYSELKKQLDGIQKVLLRKNNLDKEVVRSQLWIPNEHETEQQLLYPFDSNQKDENQNFLFEWLSKQDSLVRKAWPFTREFQSGLVSDWVWTWDPIDKGDNLQAESLKYDIFLDSALCKKGETGGYCSYTDPPCSGFQGVDAITFDPFYGDF